MANSKRKNVAECRRKFSFFRLNEALVCTNGGGGGAGIPTKHSVSGLSHAFNAAQLDVISCAPKQVNWLLFAGVAAGVAASVCLLGLAVVLLVLGKRGRRDGQPGTV